MTAQVFRDGTVLRVYVLLKWLDYKITQHGGKITVVY